MNQKWVKSQCAQRKVVQVTPLGTKLDQARTYLARLSREPAVNVLSDLNL